VDSDAELGGGPNLITLAGGALTVTTGFSTSRSITVGDASGDGNGAIGVALGDTLTLNGTVTRPGLAAAGPGALVLNAAATYAGPARVTRDCRSAVRLGCFRLAASLARRGALESCRTKDRSTSRETNRR
jgi:fibronectin-binding autotransporter adhesin